jgi:hypothetical protein
MKKRTSFLLLAIGAAALVLFAAGCGTPTVTDEGQVALSTLPGATPQPAPTEAAGAPEATPVPGEPAGDVEGELEASQEPAPASLTAPPIAEEGKEPVPAIPTAPAGSEDQAKTEAERLVAAAIADLAQRLGVAPEEITVQSVEAVEWPDTSLGCPLPGMDYAQMVVPGYHVVLMAQGGTYEYHTDRKLMVSFCGEPIDFEPIPIPPKSADDKTPWQPVDGPTPISP